MGFEASLGLALMALAVAVFVLLIPRGGRLSRVLVSDRVEVVLAMGMALLLCTGAALVLMGFPLWVLPKAG